MQPNKDVVIQFSKRLFDHKDFSVIDTHFSKDAIIRSPMRTLKGRETMREVIEKWFSAFPDLSVQWDEFISEGDKVVSRWSAIGTHLGGFFNTQPTHREIQFSGVIIYRLVNQKITEYWSLVDIHAILSQLEKPATSTERTKDNVTME